MKAALDPSGFVKVTAATTSAGSAAAGWSIDSITVQFLGVPLATVLMAFAGATISLTMVKSDKHWLVVVMAGTMIGAVCAPLVAWGAGIDPARALVLEKAIAFVLGLSVQIAIPALLRWIEKRGER